MYCQMNITTTPIYVCCPTLDPLVTTPTKYPNSPLLHCNIIFLLHDIFIYLYAPFSFYNWM